MAEKKINRTRDMAADRIEDTVADALFVAEGWCQTGEMREQVRRARYEFEKLVRMLRG